MQNENAGPATQNAEPLVFPTLKLFLPPADSLSTRHGVCSRPFAVFLCREKLTRNPTIHFYFVQCQVSALSCARLHAAPVPSANRRVFSWFVGSPGLQLTFTVCTRVHISSLPEESRLHEAHLIPFMPPSAHLFRGHHPPSDARCPRLADKERTPGDFQRRA